jgi:Ca-activated chloride channel family protein
MKRLFCIFSLTTLLLSAAFQSANAVGVLFVRPLGSDQQYDKVWIKTVDANVQINGQVALTYVDQTFMNEMSTRVEAIWIFPLPEGAVVTDLYYWFNGHRYKGAIRERQEARQQYNERIRQRIDPALLEYLGDNLYRLSIAPINANSDVRTEISYVQMLPYEFGTVEYTFLLNAVELSPKPLQRVSVDGIVQTPTAIKYIASPSHGTSTAMNITKLSDNSYRFVFGDENFTPDKDLKIVYETVRDDVQVSVLRYTPTEEDSIGDDSYYAVWITPPDSIEQDEQIPKKIVLTADVSSSMEGERIEQLKEALMAFLDNLSPIDQFNIITFGTTVIPFKDDLVPVTAENLAAARTFIIDVGALGLTNIDEAMKVSLSQSFSNDYANMIVFITDGYPTWGETTIPNILASVKNYNKQSVRIFPFGVGEDVSETLLVRMGVENGGYATFIEEDDDIAKKIGNHFKRISKPVLTDLELVIDGLTTSDKFPRPLPDLFWGSQVMQLGIYKNSGVFPVKLKGTIRGQAVEYSSMAQFPTEPGGHRFIPRLWAKAKIDFLLDQIAMFGEQEELKNQVIELSLRFQILTPYTAFYSDPNETDPSDPTGGDFGSDVADRDKTPEGFALHQNYPNPFNPTTTISYELPIAGQVVIKIYDINGRLVKVIANVQQPEGSHSIQWDGTDFSERPVAAGVYICRLEFIAANGEKFIRSMKMSLVR